MMSSLSLIIAFAVASFMQPLADSTHFVDSVSWEVRSVAEAENDGIALLTIDDGPRPETTRQILDLLDEHEAKALFFINGEPAEARPDLVEEMLARGHMVGNHGWAHENLATLEAAETGKEILRLNEWLEEHVNYEPIYFRPPYGVSTPAADVIVWEAGMRPMGWSVNSTDYTFPDEEDTIEEDADEIAARTAQALQNGNIILLHDRPVSVKALQLILDHLDEQGIRLVLPDVH